VRRLTLIGDKIPTMTGVHYTVYTTGENLSLVVSYRHKIQVNKVITKIIKTHTHKFVSRITRNELNL